MKVTAIFIAVLILAAAIALPIAALADTREESADEQPSGGGEIRLIKAVEVNIVFGEAGIRPIIASEIQTAIEEVLNLALLEQLEGDLEVIEKNLEGITETLLRVLDLTLDKRGFKTESFSILPGETTFVELEIAVSGESIADVRVEFVTPARSGLSVALLDEMQISLSTNLRRKFYGLPTADKKWLTTLFTEALDEESLLSGDFAHFSYRLELIPGTVTRAFLYLTSAPGAPVIRNQYLRTRSSTILNLSLDSAREALLVELAGLDGLPVAFIATRKGFAEDYLENLVSQLKALAFYEPEAKVELEFRGADLYASAIIESPKYRTAITGRVDFNREENNTRIDGIIGVRSFASTEVYAAIKFFPSNVDIEPEIGLGINPRPGVFVGGGWDFDRESVKLRGNVWFGTNFVVHAEYFPSAEFKEESEYGITYYFTKDFSISAYADGDGSGWVALGVKL